MNPDGAARPAAGVRAWRHFVRPGDWLVIAAGAAACVGLAPLVWTGAAAEKAMIRRDGKVFAEVDLAATKTVRVPGRLGTTVIAVEAGRARVVADPGVHQYCVRQGWLKRTGDVAICAPNRVSLHILGRGGQNAVYDSLAY